MLLIEIVMPEGLLAMMFFRHFFFAALSFISCKSKQIRFYHLYIVLYKKDLLT